MTTKVKVKKTRAERKQHSRDMQAKHEAEKKAANARKSLKSDILARLGIPKNHGGRAALSKFITEHILKGESLVQIVAMLTGSELMKQAQLAEVERLKRNVEQANQARWLQVTKRVLDHLAITPRHPFNDSVRFLAHELAEQNLNAGEIVKRLETHETVLESRRLYKEKRANLERQIDEGIAERKKTRVDMREVLAYIAKKNGTTYTPPADACRSPAHQNGEAPTRHAGNISESRLTGAESTQKENPRQYGLPNLKAGSASINKAGMSDAIKLVGGRVAEFRTYLYEHRDTGLRADVLARRFMSGSGQGNKIAAPEPVIEPGNTPAPAVTDPTRRKWTEEEKQEARDRALAAASQAGKRKVEETIGVAPVVASESQPAPQPALTTGEIEQSSISPQISSDAPLAHPKREGSTTSVVTRPDQADFAATVRRNCNDRCVITGASLRRRTEAAHLVEHSAGGLDHWSNGLLLRIDLHRLFDDNVLAICPETLTVHVDPDAQAEDPDLQQYDGHVITGLCRPIDPANLVMRWERYQRRLERSKFAEGT